MRAAPNREHIRNMAEARAHVKRCGGCYIRPDIPAEVDVRIAPLLAELQETRRATAQPLSDKQVNDIARQLLGGCQGWTRSFVRMSYWRSQAVLAIVVLGAVVVGFGAGWRAHSPPSELACADQTDGSRLCWMYTRLPVGRK
jgi:hypothetical protein